MSSPLTVTRIGHACQLIQIGGTRVLTDPWFTQSATYYPGEPVASTVEAMGRIDAVVVSHEHYDHCDLDALAGGGFDLGVPLIGPGTVAAIARGKGFRDVRAIEAWEATTAGDLTVTATPGQHGVHEVTFVIKAGGRTVFFGGRLAARSGAGHHPGQVRPGQPGDPADERAVRPPDEHAAGGNGCRGCGGADSRATAGAGSAAPLRVPQWLAGRPDDH